MAVFFDVLLFDQQILVHETYHDRTHLLSKIIQVEHGKVSP